MSPQDGWAEQDPEELLSATYECINETVNVFQRTHSLSQICAVGIANQRETTIVWDSTNGRPLYNAICEDNIYFNVAFCRNNKLIR